jgi:hypothetical protein
MVLVTGEPRGSELKTRVDKLNKSLLESIVYDSFILFRAYRASRITDSIFR